MIPDKDSQLKQKQVASDANMNNASDDSVENRD